MIRTRGFVIALLSALLAVCFAAPVFAENSASTSNAPEWKVYEFNRSGQAYRIRFPDVSAPDISFEFLNSPDTAMLLAGNKAKSRGLLGDLTNKTVSATVGVDVTDGTVFQYYGEGDTSTGNPASVRLYFQTDSPGKNGYERYWWSNQMSATLASLNSEGTTLTVSLDPSKWSDWDGKMGTYDQYHTDAFNSAAANVTEIGLSFGGGSFFANGVGIKAGTGSGSFVLKSFEVK